MNREDVLAFLSRGVRDKTITEAEAIAALKRFDAGQFPLTELPIPPNQFITGVDRTMIAEALE